VDKIISDIIAFARECVEYTGMPGSRRKKKLRSFLRIGRRI